MPRSVHLYRQQADPNPDAARRDPRLVEPPALSGHGAADPEPGRQVTLLPSPGLATQADRHHRRRAGIQGVLARPGAMTSTSFGPLLSSLASTDAVAAVSASGG